jgi:hypothetical protein
VSTLLADVLRRLEPQLPRGVQLEFQPPGRVATAVGQEVPSTVDVSESIRRGDDQAAVWVVLSHVQDHVVRSIGRAWPAAPDGTLAAPNVERSGGGFAVWFGTRSTPVLDLGTFDV